MNLQDCELISKEISYGNLGIYGDMGYEIIPSVNGILYKNIISAHPNSSIKYKIPKDSTFFSCKIALNDSSEEFSSCNFEIYVDEELRFSSHNLGKFVISHAEIILDNNSEIELVCKIQNKIICHGLWIDASFNNKPKYVLDSINKTRIKSKYHKENPYQFTYEGGTVQVDYTPAEATGDRRKYSRGTRRCGRHAHRRRQVAVLPAPRALL